VPFPARENEGHARARVLLVCHAQQEPEGKIWKGRIERHKMDRTLVAKRKNRQKTGGAAESRVYQNRTYGELPKRKMVREKVVGNRQGTHHVP